jgi:transcriptional regulator with XRE-family HTH domain
MILSTAHETRPADAATIATNLRRLMARDGLTYGDVVAATGLDERTIRGVARAANRPHARTLHKLVEGLNWSVDELFLPPGRSPQRFDRETNPEIATVVGNRGELFEHWSEADFDELYSQFGMGGSLNEAGVVAAAEAINAKRSLLRQVSVILESGESELLADLVRFLYQRIALAGEAARDMPESRSSPQEPPEILRIGEFHNGRHR